MRLSSFYSLLFLILLYYSCRFSFQRIPSLPNITLPMTIRVIPIRSISDMVSLKARNNTVLVTMTTYGYLDITLEFYRNSQLQKYSNFFCVTLELDSYLVCLFFPSLLSTSLQNAFQLRFCHLAMLLTGWNF